MATNFPTSLDSFTNPTSTDAMNSVTVPHATQHANINDAVEALEAKVGINSSGVATSHDYKINALETAVNGGLLSNVILKSPEERWNVSATAATGTVNFDTITSGAWLYTTNASANWTLNVRGDGSNSLDSLLTTGDSITVAFAVTQGATPYYQSAFQIDGSSVTPEWQGGSAPSAGNASSIDVYVFTIIKTASATFTVLGSQTQFA